MVENIIQIGIPIIGVITAIITASLSYYYTKKNQLDADERRLKERFYIAYIQAISDIVISPDIEHAMDSLAKAQNQLLLIGSVDVVSSILKFHDYVKQSELEEQVLCVEKHNILLTEILKSMRKDLYKNKNINQDYPIVHLTGNN